MPLFQLLCGHLFGFLPLFAIAVLWPRWGHEPSHASSSGAVRGMSGMVLVVIQFDSVSSGRIGRKSGETRSV